MGPTLSNIPREGKDSWIFSSGRGVGIPDVGSKEGGTSVFETCLVMPYQNNSATPKSTAAVMILMMNALLEIFINLRKNLHL